MIRPRIAATACAAFLVAALLPSLAGAHAFLAGSRPAVGARVATAPHRLVLRFTEAVVVRFSRVRVIAPGGATVPTGKPHLRPGHPLVLVLALPRLAPGTYTVAWHAVSVDTHRTEGSFRFTVGGARSP